VTAKGHAKAGGGTQGVDRDIVTVFQVIAEGESPFAKQNLEEATLAEDRSPFKYVINGKVRYRL
jgi:hypothetical protein